MAGTDAQTEIQTELKIVLKKLKVQLEIRRAKIIAETSKKLTGISNSFTGDLTKNAATTLGGKLNSGLKRKYTEVYTLVLLATKNTNRKESRDSSTNSDVRSCSKITEKITLCD